LLSEFPNLKSLNTHYEVFKLEETVLVTTDGSEARVCRRGQHGHYDYRHTTEVVVEGGLKVRRDRQISGREYAALITQANPSETSEKM
jgi:hypothetical protein